MAGFIHIQHKPFAVDTNATGEIVAAVASSHFHCVGGILVADTAGVEIALRDGATGSYLMASASNGVPLAQYGGFVLPMVPDAGSKVNYWFRTSTATRLDLVIVAGSGRITGFLSGYYWDGQRWKIA